MPIYTQEKVAPSTQRCLFPPIVPNRQGQEALYRVLKAYSIYDNEVGYCQGSNFIVGVVLMFLAEEESFWLLVALMESPRYQVRRASGVVSTV